MALTKYVLPLSSVTLDSLPQVGGKNASLGEMLSAMAAAGVRVPDGFATTVDAFWLHLDRAGLREPIYEELDGLDARDPRALATAGEKIRSLVCSARLPEEVREAVRDAYTTLGNQHGSGPTDVAVRSSATAEDLPSASFAGQQDTYLNVRGGEALEEAVRACMASLFTDRAIVYRAEHGIAHADVALSVGVQKMVRSDKGAAGVLFTLDPDSGFRDVVVITGAWGLGESVVQGRVNPDEFCVFKPTLASGHHAVVRRKRGEKAVKLIYAARGARAGRDGDSPVREVAVSRKDRGRYVLDDEELMQLARWSVAIEDHYSARAGHPGPMDLECANDALTGEQFIAQARPETVHSQRPTPTLEIYSLKAPGTVRVTGQSVGSRIAAGTVRIITRTADLPSFERGEILVATTTNPDWEPVLEKAAAVITDKGGRTCHAAIVSRELGLPCVVGCGEATTVLRDGEEVTVSCAESEQGRVYAGLLDFDVQRIDPATLPVPRVPLMFNLADPEKAFLVAQLPNAGVGLTRIEFLVSSWIGIHPMALVHAERLSVATRKKITARIHGEDPQRFFIERLASGVAQIAAAFHPRPVIVRMSDFKSNEYAGLLGGAPFELDESNPMIGFRGACRYYDDRYREGFALECRAIRRVRDHMGLTNVKVMIPFCRTLEEGRRVLDEMAASGLTRGENGLEVYVMCEIPSNVILAAEFAELFDGFSIGSNDLTQLTLGADRDSELLSHVFDERDAGVKRMIEMVIERAHRKGRPVGICGEAPSNYPEFAEWLVSIGIDSMSLSPDSLLEVTKRLAPRPQTAAGTG